MSGVRRLLAALLRRPWILALAVLAAVAALYAYPPRFAHTPSRYQIDVPGFFRHVNLDYPGLGLVKTAVLTGDYDRAVDEYLRWRETAANRPRFFFDPNDGELGQELRETYRDQVAESVEVADHLLRDQLRFEGHVFRLTDPPNYFPKRWGRVATKIGRLFGVDVSRTRPLEDILVNSFEFVTRNLAIAYLATGDERYARRFCAWFRNWTAAASPLPDPYLAGDVTHPQAYFMFTVARRAISWLHAYDAFQKSSCLDPKTRFDILRQILAHVLYVDASMGDALAGRGREENRAFWLRYYNAPLVTASRQASTLVMFPELKTRDVMLGNAFRMLERYFDNYVTAEGHEPERDSGYHMGAFVYTMDLAIIAGLNGVTVPARLKQRLEQTVEVLLRIIQPNGYLPAAGNISLAVEPGGYFALGAAVFGRGDFAYFVPERLDIETYMTLRRWRKRPAHAAVPPRRPRLESDALPSTGFYVMRSGGGLAPADKRQPDESLYLFFDLAPSHGHTHYDALNIIIAGYGSRPPYNLLDESGVGQNWAVNPHTAYYFSARAHNLISIDGKEPPSWNGDPAPVLRKWWSTSFVDVVSAGYGKRYRENEVVRSLVFVKGEYWILRDEIQGRGRHLLEQVFNFAPVVRTTRDGQRVRVHDIQIDVATKAAVPGYAGPRLLIVPADSARIAARLTDGWKWHPYFDGTLPPPGPFGDVPSPTLVYAMQADTATPAVFETILYPLRKGEARSVRVARLAASGDGAAAGRISGLRIDVGPSSVAARSGSAAKVDYFLTNGSPSSVVYDGAIELLGRHALLRSGPGRGFSLMCMIDGHALSAGEQRMVAVNRADACLNHKGGDAYVVESSAPVTLTLPVLNGASVMSARVRERGSRGPWRAVEARLRPGHSAVDIPIPFAGALHLDLGHSPKP